MPVVSTNNENRWSELVHLIDTWWTPLRAQDGVPEVLLQATEGRLGVAIPRALREWYALAGRRMDFHLHNPVPIDSLHVNDNVLIFYWENQGIFPWGLRRSDLGQDDPLVVTTQDELFDENDQEIPGEWTPLNITVSQFLQRQVVEATIMCGVFSGRNLHLDVSVAEAIEHEYDCLQLACDYYERIYYDEDTLIGWWRASNGQLLMDASMRRKAAVEEFLRRTGCNFQMGHMNGARGIQYGHNYGPTCRDVGPPYIIRMPYPEGIELPDIFPDCNTLANSGTISAKFLRWIQGRSNRVP